MILLTQKTEKYLLALKCLIAASSLDKENESVKEQKTRFKKVVESELEGVDAKVVELIKEEFAKL